MARGVPAPPGGPGRQDRGERFGHRGGIPGLLMLSAFVLGTLALGALMGSLTRPELAGWYHLLAAPPGTVPDRIFAPVWTALYAAMAIAAWRVWLRAGLRPLGWWFVQLLLGAAWTPAFFVLHAPAAALGVILALWLAILACLRAFRPIDGVASGLLMPYLAWVTYAAYLNAGFVWLN